MQLFLATGVVGNSIRAWPSIDSLHMDPLVFFILLILALRSPSLLVARTACAGWWGEAVGGAGDQGTAQLVTSREPNRAKCIS